MIAPRTLKIELHGLPYFFKIKFPLESILSLNSYLFFFHSIKPESCFYQWLSKIQRYRKNHKWIHRRKILYWICPVEVHMENLNLAAILNFTFSMIHDDQKLHMFPFLFKRKRAREKTSIYHKNRKNLHLSKKFVYICMIQHEINDKKHLICDPVIVWGEKKNP